MHHSQLAADRIAAAQHVITLHLPSLSGELCSACGHPFPCGYRRAADGTLDAYGRLPRRLPGATLRAAGVLRAAGGVAWTLMDANGLASGRPQPRHGDPDGRDQQGRRRAMDASGRASGSPQTRREDSDDRDRQGRRRGWFDAAVNPAVGVAKVPNGGRPSRFVPFQRSGS